LLRIAARAVLEEVVREVSADELLAAARAGRVLDCGDAGALGRLDAALLRRCCLELKSLIDRGGIKLRRAEITGLADLSGLELLFPLSFAECAFQEALVVEGAQLFELAVTGCMRLPGLLANGVRIRRDLDLSGTQLEGAHNTTASTSMRAAIWLCESEIAGRLLCVDTVIDAGSGRSIQGDRMQVSGNVRLLHKFTAHGEVRLIGAHIGGSLDLTGASIESSSDHGLALDLGESVIDGSVFLISDERSGRSPQLHGRIDMGGARIAGQFLIRGARLEAHGVPVGSSYSRYRTAGTVLSAPRLTVGAETTLDDSCHVLGGIDLSMSELSSLSVGPGCALDAPASTALDLTNAQLLSNFTVADKATVLGTMRLSGARIHGNVGLRGAILSAPEGRSLVAAQGVTVDGDVELQELTATGGDLGFRAATIGGVVDAAGAQLRNDGGYTLNLHQANVRGSVRLAEGFSSTGVVVLNRATIEGRFTCATASFGCPGPSDRNQHGHAIEAISATIRGGIDLGWAQPPQPSVDFTNASTSFLADDPSTWPPRFAVSGFTYDRFEQPQGGSSAPTWDHAARCEWLKHQGRLRRRPVRASSTCIPPAWLR
jgi:hypothetical protein